jgi:hypothetical protein
MYAGQRHMTTAANQLDNNTHAANELDKCIVPLGLAQNRDNKEVILTLSGNDAHNTYRHARQISLNLGCTF